MVKKKDRESILIGKSLKNKYSNADTIRLILQKVRDRNKYSGEFLY